MTDEMHAAADRLYNQITTPASAHRADHPGR
jgi:hypothetical protein